MRGAMKIEAGKRVRVQAMLKVVGGPVLEKSAVEYFQGGGTMLGGIEKILDGLAPGDERKGVLKAHDAFGAEDQQPKKTIARKEFPAEADLKPGSVFVAKGPGGQDINLQIVRVNKDSVETKLVHALADKDIEYELKVLSVSDPTPPPMPGDALTEDE